MCDDDDDDDHVRWQARLHRGVRRTGKRVTVSQKEGHEDNKTNSREETKLSERSVLSAVPRHLVRNLLGILTFPALKTL